MVRHVFHNRMYIVLENNLLLDVSQKSLEIVTDVNEISHS